MWDTVIFRVCAYYIDPKHIRPLVVINHFVPNIISEIYGAEING